MLADLGQHPRPLLVCSGDAFKPSNSKRGRRWEYRSDDKQRNFPLLHARLFGHARRSPFRNVQCEFIRIHTPLYNAEKLRSSLNCKDCLQGVGLDSHSKQWRLFADCFNNIGVAKESRSFGFFIVHHAVRAAAGTCNFPCRLCS